MAWETIFIDGFDHYNTVAQGVKKGWSTFDPNSFVAGRYSGSQAVRLSASPSNKQKLIYTPSDAVQSVSMGLAVTGISSGTSYIYFKDISSEDNLLIVGLGVSGGTISVYGTWVTTVSVATGKDFYNDWHHLEIYADFGNEYVVKVDGVIIASEVVASPSNLSSKSIMVYAVHTLHVDDVFIRTASHGEGSSGMLGDMRVQYLAPTADVEAAFTGVGIGTANYENVDESPIVDETDYNESDTAGHRDLFTMADLTNTDRRIECVQLVSLAKRIDTGESIGFNSVVKVDGNYYSKTDYPATTSEFITQRYDKNPSTNDKWTGAEVNALETGYQISAG